jgi:hypothetical protein
MDDDGAIDTPRDEGCDAGLGQPTSVDALLQGSYEVLLHRVYIEATERTPPPSASTKVRQFPCSEVLWSLAVTRTVAERREKASELLRFSKILPSDGT